MNQIPVFLADDSALLREGVAGLLGRQGFEVVGSSSRADATIDAIRQLATQQQLPQILITDVRMPPTMTTDGLRAAIELKREFANLAVMVLSQYVATTHAVQLFDLPTNGGGCGYLLKDRIAQVADFVTSLKTVASGGMVIDPDVAKAMLRSRRSGIADLTAREAEVLELMAQGMSNNQIAGQLFVTGASVAKHVSNIFTKLGLAPSEENRRVRAILAYLSDQSSGI